MSYNYPWLWVMLPWIWIFPYSSTKFKCNWMTRRKVVQSLHVTIWWFHFFFFKEEFRGITMCWSFFHTGKMVSVFKFMLPWKAGHLNLFPFYHVLTWNLCLGYNLRNRKGLLRFKLKWSELLRQLKKSPSWCTWNIFIKSYIFSLVKCFWYDWD